MYKIKLDKITYKLFIFYWPLVMLNYFLLMSTKINLTMLLVDLPLVLFAIKALTIMVNNSKGQFIPFYCLFALYVIFSFIPYSFNDTPEICFFKGIQYYFVPILFAPLGYSYSSDYDYNKSYIISCAACFIIGFFLYATLPPYYVEFLAEVQGYEGFSQDELMGLTRFSSFLPGSYNISYLSVPALTLSLAYASNPQTKMKGWLCYTIALISFIAAILCQQRIAMFFAVMVVAFYMFYLSKRGNIKMVFIIVAAAAILFVVMYNYISRMEFFDTLLDNIIGRFKKMDISDAMSSRTGQYQSFSRATWWSYAIGLGMGSCGHLVIPFNLQAIYDGEFVKTFYEFGLIGTSIFIALTIVTLLRGVKHFKYLHSEVLIMLFFLGACVGASALTFFIYNSMFWFSMGRIWNKDYLSLSKKECRYLKKT